MAGQYMEALNSTPSLSLMERVNWRRFSLRLGAGWLALLLGFGVVYWGGVWFLAPEQKTRYSWSSDIQFLFPGVAEGRYPNGMAFSVSDLISEVVLARVLANLPETNISLTPEELASQLAITSYFPRANDVIQSYEARLTPELSQVEVQELEVQFQTEMSRGVRGQARLVLTTPDPTIPGQAILEAIPEAWSTYVKEDLQALSADRIIYSDRVMEDGQFTDADFVFAYGMIREQLNLLRRNLGVLGGESNSGLVRDPRTGRRLADIEAQLKQLDGLYIDNLLSQVVGLGLTRNPQQTLAFLQSRSERLQREVTLLEEQAAHIDEALADYGQIYGGGEGSNLTRIGGTGDAFLDRLVALGVEGGDLAFRQSLTRERLALDLEATIAKSELDRLQSLSESMSSVRGANVTASDEQAMVSSIKLAFNEIIEETRAMFRATNGIAEQMDFLQLGGDAVLYRINHVSQEPIALSSMFSRSSVYWFLVLMLALALAVLALVSILETLHMIENRRRG